MVDPIRFHWIFQVSSQGFSHAFGNNNQIMRGFFVGDNDAHLPSSPMSWAKEMVMSPENVKRKRSAMDFNAIEAEPFIKALKDGGTRRDDAGRARGQLMSNSCLSPSRAI